MIRTFTPASARSRATVAGVLLSSLAALALTGCQAGSSAQTSQPYNPSDGRNVNIVVDENAAGCAEETADFSCPYLAVRNALVVSDGGAASVTVAVVNHGDQSDVLKQIDVNGQVAAFVGGPFEIAPGDKISIGGGSDAVALVQDAGVEPGVWTDLTLTFETAGTTVISVLVVSSDDEYTVLGENA